MADTTKALEVLAKGLRLEEDGRKFYLHAAEGTTNSRGKELFSNLADDELKHWEMIKRQHDALSQGGDWVDVPEARDVEPIDLGKPLFPQDEGSLKEIVPPEASEIDALFIALKAESDSYNLYRQAARDASDPAGRSMYVFLSRAEQGHFDRLMANWEYMTPLDWTP